MRGLIGAALALAACGADVAPPARAVDATPPIDAAPGPITVRVLATVQDPGATLGAPLAGVQVAFLPPDGPALITISDDAGLATATVPSGGAVVVVRRRPFDAPDVTIFLDVPAGSALVDGNRPRWFGGASLGARAATIAPWPSGTVELTASCAGRGFQDSATSMRWFQPRCTRADDATVVAVAHASDGSAAYAARAHVDLTDVEVIALPPWQPLTDTELILTNIPEVRTLAVVTRRQLDLDAEWSSVTATGSIEGASLVVPVPVVPIGELATLEVQLESPVVTTLHARLVRPALERRTVVDVTATAPPTLGTRGFDVATRALTWTYQGGNGRRPDVVVATFTGVVANDAVTFRVIAPGDRTQVTLPILPPELAEVDLGPEATTVGLVLVAVELPAIGAYAAAASLVGVARRDAELDGELLSGLDQDWWLSLR
ncbi:MAG: hypothetical protein IPL61_33385 [Myxococcales bacterium]|nr:hypothetical protein [Myxococcales bacterium]